MLTTKTLHTLLFAGCILSCCRTGYKDLGSRVKFHRKYKYVDVETTTTTTTSTAAVAAATTKKQLQQQ
jgi:hypothetical protein